MAVGMLSPRQKMINMMYLVLTALLALNVSKEVLNSFFEVNQGIERTTESLKSKSAETYAAFDAAAEFNEVKAGPYKKKAYSVKAKADSLIEFIQKMKYELVLLADGVVYLGSESENKDEEGKLIEEKGIEKEWKDLTPEQKLMNIGALSRKDDRNASGDLFYSDKRKKNISTDLKNKMLTYKDFLLSLADGNPSLITSINETYTLADEKGNNGDPDIIWEEYNFYDMPSVGALTLLSNMQLNARNTEADVINMLMEKIDAKSLKFTSAEGIQIPQSNFVLRGDSFRAQIFISAKDTTQEPEIFVGEVEYDSLEGKYQMIGDYDTIKVLNGKGMFAARASSEGVKKWGGLIKMKITANTFKYYPFKGEYLVAAKMVVAAPTNMNVLYKGIKNPISVSVAGYSPSQISVSCTNGTITTINKKAGKYEVTPEKLIQKNSPIINLYVTSDGKRKSMGSVDFKVKKVPDPAVMCAQQFGGLISKGDLSSADGLYCKMKDFPFDRKALSYQVISFDVSAYNKGIKRNIPTVHTNKFNKKVIEAIKGTPPGGDITFTNIKVKLKKVKNAQVRKLPSLTFTIK